MLKVMIVEDQMMLRDSLTNAINAQEDMEVVVSFASALDCLDVIGKLDIDVCLLDVCTEGDASGIVACKQIKEKSPDTCVVIMTGMPEVTFVEQAKEAGANGFLYKNLGTDELLDSLRHAAAGETIFPSESQGDLRLLSLTDEEIDILRLVCETKSRKEIAAELYMSEGTVKRRISDILDKTGFDSILKLAVYAVSGGYIVPKIH